ncbi:MAG: hypothetical protein NTX91_01780 [candidate division SR1 bacterium]|nr:hypothetical protein [candidate division SR1 bacterium]
MKKGIILGICSIVLCGCYVSAGGDNGDCGLITNTGDISNSKAYQSFTQNFGGKNIEGVLPAEAISQALINLKLACCTSTSINKDAAFCASFKNKKDYPNSIYLYDQLLDVSIRRLDGDSNLAYGLEPDPTGKAWKEFITTAAESKDGASAQAILERWNTDRSRSKILPDDVSPQGISDFILNYNLANTTLADKYYNVCTVIGNIYKQMNGGVAVNTNTQKACQNLINKRIADENNYTQIIIIKKSNELLHNTLQAYTQKYFVQEKMMVLLTLMNKVKSLFSTMVQQAATLNSTPSK